MRRCGSELGFVLFLVLATGCSSSTGDETDGDEVDSGPVGTGGNVTGAGGGASTGGAKATGTGGAKGTGGVTGTGGIKATGGATGTGGGTGTGGATGSGGVTGSGGATGSGGSTGTGGTPNVLACDKLGTIGTWEDITPPGGALASGSITQAFVVDPVNAGTVYLGWGHGGSTPTDKTGIWKTTDCGATWVHVSTGTNGKDVDSAGHWAMAIDFVDPKVLYTANGYGTSGVFKSTNGGVDWTQIFPADIAAQFIYGGFIERITMDPTDHLHLIVSPHFTCTDGKSCLAETKDGGVTWRILRGTPESGEDTGQMMIDSKVWLWGGTFQGLSRTSDGGSTWTQVSSGNSSDSLYHAKDGSWYVAHPFGVLHSKDSISWSVIPNSPGGGRAIVGDGTTLFNSNRSDSAIPYNAAPENDTSKWTPYAPSAKVTRGGWILGYDTSHHILYSSTESKGFWRVVTK